MCQTICQKSSADSLRSSPESFSFINTATSERSFEANDPNAKWRGIWNLIKSLLMEDPKLRVLEKSSSAFSNSAARSNWILGDCNSSAVGIQSLSQTLWKQSRWNSEQQSCSPSKHSLPSRRHWKSELVGSHKKWKWFNFRFLIKCVPYSSSPGSCQLSLALIGRLSSPSDNHSPTTKLSRKQS